MKNLIINNARIATPSELIEKGGVVIKNGIIAQVSGTPIHDNLPGFENIDAKGLILMPGIIDIHTDAMDYEINPRTSADFPIDVAFSELEKKLCGAGITTVYHSIHLGYRDAEFNLRSKYSRLEVFENVYAEAQKHTMINNKIHLRYEISGNEDYDLCFELVEKGYISLFSFMDHTPGQGQYPLDKYLIAASRRGVTEQEALEELKKKQARPRISKDQIRTLAEFLKDKNIPIASHDDDSVEKVIENHQMGISICEFPINMETARRATDLNLSVIGGASNVLRGGSTGGNLNALDAIAEGVMDTLCSDYYPPAILHSVFRLYQQQVLPLNQAVNLATLNAARAVNIHKNTGSIEVGKEADMILVDDSNYFPTVVKTIVSGNISSKFSLKTNQVAELSQML